jgi:hypothetical protein
MLSSLNPNKIELVETLACTGKVCFQLYLTKIERNLVHNIHVFP